MQACQPRSGPFAFLSRTRDGAVTGYVTGTVKTPRETVERRSLSRARFRRQDTGLHRLVLVGQCRLRYKENEDKASEND
jgi:hypothetical protein